MKKIFNYEFEDESEQAIISYEYDEEIEEQLSIKIENGCTVIYGNKSAFLLLAKIFSKLAISDYEDGFHLHINNDFDTDNIETLRIVVNN